MKHISIAVFSCLLSTIFTSTPKTIWNHFITEQKEVALTFDDGPGSTSTLKVLDVLNRKKIKATFFMLGENVVRFPEVVNRVYAEGHTIGLHSYSHANFHKLNTSEIKNEITSNQTGIAKIIGEKPQIIRPPYGIITNDFLSVAMEMGLTIYTWSNDSFDWKKSNNSSAIINNALKKVVPGSIILMHDKSANSDVSLKALPVIIDKLQKDGYKFVTLKKIK